MIENKKLDSFRDLMLEEDIDIYIVPTADFHQSEYVGEYFKSRVFLTGFTGSAGTALITRDKAGLWTDGRYFIQAENELDPGFKLYKMGEEGVPSIEEFIEAELPRGGVLAFDGRVVSMEEGRAYERIIEHKEAKIKYNLDLVDKIWENRPELSKEPAFSLELKYAGETSESKLRRIREKMAELGASSHIITSLDDIAWILNIRGNDVAFSPLVLSYCIITMDELHIFIDEEKLDQEMKDELKRNGLTSIHEYNQIYEAVKELDQEEKVLIDPVRVNYALYNNIDRRVKKIEKTNPSVLFKAIKNPVEVENMRIAQLKDSIAHVKFIYWLKNNFDKEEITEISASNKLDDFRREQGDYIRPSFDPISSFGENAAIVHYSPSEESNRTLEAGSLFLTDTGAGYYQGSTDITRTYALGEIPARMKEDFTLVVISNLSLSRARFLEGCNGMNLDILARAPFWDRNLNFNHGTGHGMGYLLNIHEDPIGFRWKYSESEGEAFQEGMVITNEPGIYIAGSHGIRLENELLVRKGVKNEYGQFMYFETMTHIPFDLDAIEPSIMTEEEKSWLNQYHKEVYDRLESHLTEDEREWLKEYTREI